MSLIKLIEMLSDPFKFLKSLANKNLLQKFQLFRPLLNLLSSVKATPPLKLFFLQKDFLLDKDKFRGNFSCFSSNR